MCWNRVQRRHSEDSMDFKELDSFYMCNKGKGVLLPVYKRPWNKRNTNVTSRATKPALSALFIRTRTWFALHSHGLCFKCWKWPCIIFHSRGKLLTKTCQLHGNSQLFNAANWGDGASEICFRSVPVRMKRQTNLKFPSLQRLSTHWFEHFDNPSLVLFQGKSSWLALPNIFWRWC